MGRLSGYDYNGESICFTNIMSLEKYEELWDKKFDRSVNWTSNSTKFKNGKLESKGTFNRLLTNNSESRENDIDEKEVIIEYFNSQEEAAKYHNSKFKKIDENKKQNYRGHNKKKKNDDGYYLSTIRSITKVWSKKEIEQNKSYGLNNNKSRYYACYEDTNDKSTLKFCITHYKI